MRISILHPFTPMAVGLNEKDIPAIHSQPHLKALQMLSERQGYSCSIEYFTSKWRGYQLNIKGVTYKFYRLSYKRNGDHEKWKKQGSNACLKDYKRDMPEVSIINMSAHSSPFSYRLSKTILRQKKQYIAMLGGQHYSDNVRNRDYYKNAHHILVHTHFQKNEILQMDLFQGLDIRIFPLGVDCSFFTPDLKKNNSPALLYVGRILELKRVHLAIEALKELVSNGFSNATLDIVGPISSESYFTLLKTMVSEFGLEENVNFHGQKKHSELVPFYQQADLFTLPSQSESFGMVMVESMACGTPVAATLNSGGPADIIEDRRDGVLASPENYSAAILNFFKNPDLQEEMSSNAREKAEKSYSLYATYQALEDSVNSVLDDYK